MNGTLGTRAEKIRESLIRLRKGREVRGEGGIKVVKANQSTIYYKLYTFIFKLTFVNFVKKIIFMSPKNYAEYLIYFKETTISIIWFFDLNLQNLQKGETFLKLQMKLFHE